MLVNIACLQTGIKPDFESAIEEALGLARQVDGDTRVLFLPEYCGGLKTADGRFAPPVSSESKHPVLRALCDYARQASVWIVAGSMAVARDLATDSATGSVTESAADNRFNNRGFVINDKGEVVSHYDKIHLFDIQLAGRDAYKESEVVAPGDKLSVVETPLGLMGHTICYDLRFPNLYRALSQAGAAILAVPAAFTRLTGEAHWHALCRARAIENGCYVIAPCSVGMISGGGEAYGHSLVVDPWGEIVADGGDSPRVVMATIDTAKVSAARAQIPSLEHDRKWTQPVQQGDTSGAGSKLRSA